MTKPTLLSAPIEKRIHMKSPFLKSFIFAAQGIVKTFRLGFNFKVMLVFALCALILGLIFQISLPEWALIFICIGMVLGGECLNTALEKTIDLVSPTYHELAGIAKDCAAGAVLILSIASFCVALLIFIPKLIALFI